MNITIIVNGKRIQADVPAGQTLLQFLREQGYRSVKYGCETTNCGLYSVWMSGETVLSHSVPVGRTDSHHITTLEDVEREAREFADFMTRGGAEQCGFCSPGMMIQVLAMKKESRTWTDEETKHWLAGNLCRRTDYTGQFRATRAWLLKGGETV